MRYGSTLILISLFALAGCAQTPPDPNRKPSSTHSARGMRMEELGADKETASVLRKDIPGLLEDKHYPVFKSMSLRVIASLSNGELSSQTLAQTEADLRTVHPIMVSAPLK